MIVAQSTRRYRAALRRIDALHRQDPRHIHWRGRERPFELVYGWCMSAWRRQLAPAADEPLRLAVRAQHLCRWELPRTDFPAGRRGYLAWRREQAVRHARRLVEVLDVVGYDTAVGERCTQLVRKQGLGTDAEVQVLEDCAALTYLQIEHADFAARTDPARMQHILERTLAKVSAPAAELARTLLQKGDIAAMEHLRN